MAKKIAKTEVIDVETNEPSNDVQEYKNPGIIKMQQSTDQLISQAIDKNVPVETMEKLLAMRRELRAEASKEAYDRAMSQLQGDLPVIKKTKIVLDKYGKERYRYSPIDSIIDQTKRYISRHGFSYAITTEQSEVVGEVKAICTVKHEFGHSENSTFRVPIDKDSYMTAPQKVGSALTFAKRYAFCNAFGIITGDQDNDANDVEEEQQTPPQTPPVAPPVQKPVLPQFITKEQAGEINGLLKALHIDMAGAMKEMENIVERDVGEFKNLTTKEADAIIAEFNKRLLFISASKAKAPEIRQVEVVNTPQSIDPSNFNVRVMNCKTQQEAIDIIGEAALTKDISEVKFTALKGILTAKGFKV